MRKEKDNVELLRNIAELGGLFEKSQGLSDFLQTVVSIVAWHMRAAVCSIYLFDEDEEVLILRANQGLNAEAIGRLKLKPGEGIVGMALKELRPIVAAVASEHPYFKSVPGIGEERYKAFLAVPILRGLARIGALVVQDTQPDYFHDEDIKTLRAIAAQLANVIESAKLLMNLHQGAPAQKTERMERFKFLQGKTASRGIAMGKALIMDASGYDILTAENREELALNETHFRGALKETERQLTRLQKEMEDKFGDIASLIFSAHLLILQDEQFTGAILQRIGSGGSPQQAIIQVVTEYVNLFSQSRNERLHEKIHDIKDLGHRLLHNLLALGAGRSADETVDYKGHIIVASGLMPSDVVKLAAQRAEGIVMIGGGVVSHIAILARSFEIPMVICDTAELLALPEGLPLLMDANQGAVYVDPSDEVVARYRQHADAVQMARERPPVKPETRTRCGARIQLMANINLLSDLELARLFHADGVGLYRSEFPFIVRHDFPSEEEQYRIYLKVVTAMSGREVIFRTLDIGGDKVLSYYPMKNEANPFLGLRAIRFLLRNKAIFSEQLRAMLRAAVDAPARIMFPLVSSVDEFLQAREVVFECMAELRARGTPFNDKVRLGVMVELPAASEIADELAQETEFLSIGTNDLIQYMLAVDRTNDAVAQYYLAYHPAVLRALKRIVDAAQRHDKPVSVCGDAAADEKMIPFLLGLGIRKLSVDVRAIPRVQSLIESIDLERAAEVSRRLLKMGRLADIGPYINSLTW